MQKKSSCRRQELFFCGATMNGSGAAEPFMVDYSLKKL